MTAISSTPTILSPVMITNEAKFLNDLEIILQGDFNAKVYPSEDGRISKAKINTEESLDGQKLRNLISLAAKWNLPIFISRSGAGLRILYGKQ